MHLNLSEKIFSFFHRFIEKKYHLRTLSKILKYKVKTNLDKLISIMMENDLKIEKN